MLEGIERDDALSNLDRLLAERAALPEEERQRRNERDLMLLRIAMNKMIASQTWMVRLIVAAIAAGIIAQLYGNI
jgi:hypothetical protein